MVDLSAVMQSVPWILISSAHRSSFTKKLTMVRVRASFSRAFLDMVTHNTITCLFGAAGGGRKQCVSTRWRYGQPRFRCYLLLSPECSSFCICRIININAHKSDTLLSLIEKNGSFVCLSQNGRSYGKKPYGIDFSDTPYKGQVATSISVTFHVPCYIEDKLCRSVLRSLHYMIILLLRPNI